MFVCRDWGRLFREGVCVTTRIIYVDLTLVNNARDAEPRLHCLNAVLMSWKLIQLRSITVHHVLYSKRRGLRWFNATLDQHLLKCWHVCGEVVRHIIPIFGAEWAAVS